MSVNGMEEGVLRSIPMTIIPLPSLLPFFNAKSQSRKVAKEPSSVFASPRLCDFALKGLSLSVQSPKSAVRFFLVEAGHAALHSGSFTQFHNDFTTYVGRIFNPDSESGQSREGAKFFSSWRLCAFAPLKGLSLSVQSVQSVPLQERIAHFRRDFSDGLFLRIFFHLCDFASLRLCVEMSFLSVKSVKSVVQLLWVAALPLWVIRGSILFDCGFPRYDFCVSSRPTFHNQPETTRRNRSFSVSSATSCSKLFALSACEICRE